ncbi:O-fucosyltransferase 7-like isoform X2 [Rhododendron vialii]|uniref:O-fucosyltransferase 7-like isoform X2 n=1 Tax=Rhododendron vialii TaxID=182163 RepID=UPI00265F94BA|nr:O-fucosyltransferase 7-like isoform X2 [Rhododendron vialii]
MHRRRCTLGLVRRLLLCAIGAIGLLALLYAHVGVSPSSQVANLPDSYKLPVQQEIGYEKLGGERSLKIELVPLPPHLSRTPLPACKLDGAAAVLELDKLWKPPPNRDYVPCVEPSRTYTLTEEPRGYLLVHTNGGLNQMRAGICDMVAVARLINATLVIPELDKRSFWQDTSNFSDVFDEDHFISSLANDVSIIKKLPKELANATRAVKHFRSWSGIDYYQDEIASMWADYQVIRAAKSDSRLANNDLPPEIQKLRCRACYEALRFSPCIEAMGKLLVDRMRSYGPYIALHLRYEKDMLAFSGCTHDLSPEEADELKTIRENTAYWKVKDINSTEQRAKGYCPLTPKEIGIFLTALRFPSKTPIYIAAGEIYGGDSRVVDLQSRYPLLMNKEKLASAEELEPFINHASQMAALDFIVSVESDIFIPSYSGNMARAVEGHRRFLGHRKTISPDRKALVHLVDKIQRGTLKEGKKVSTRVAEIHKRRQGSPRKRKGPISGTKGTDRFRSEEAFYVNPLPDCLCQKETSTVIL